MKQKITTTDLADFGWRERKMAEELLKASREQGLPEDFDDNETTIMFNMHSGCVFFINADLMVAMMNGDKLELFYSCPRCGHEGFAEDMEHDGNKDCRDYLKEIGVVKETEETES